MKNNEVIFSLKGIKYKDILDIPTLLIRCCTITGIVGKSGSGKTTLLRLLNKLVSPDSGHIMLNDKSLSEIDPVTLRRKVVMMSQNPVIFDGNIKDNLLAGLRFSGKKEIDDEMLKKVLESVELEKSLTDPVENLSGGEKQRLALGRVIIMKPDILLLDEPSSALDDKTEDEVMGKIAKFVRAFNIKLIFVTHSKAMAQKYADEIIEIYKGSVSYLKQQKDE